MEEAVIAMDFTFEDAWQRKDLKQQEEAKFFWEAHNLLPAQLREQRAKELVSLARAGGELAGISTALVQYFPQLRGRFAFFRCAAAPAVDRRELAGRLAVEAFGSIGAWAAENHGEKVLGLITVIEGDDLGERARYPMWPEHGMHLNLVGYAPQGQQIRVAWFEHARVEAEEGPAPSQQEAKQWAV